MDLSRIFSENLISGHSFGTHKSRKLSDGLFLAAADGSVRQRWFLAFLKFVVGAVAAALMTQLFLLQMIQGTAFRASALSNSLQKIPVEAERGLILSAEGEVLAGNAPSFNLYYYGSLCRNQNCPADFLRPLSFYSDSLATTLKSPETTVVYDLKQSDALALPNLIKDKIYLELKTGQKRSYPLTDSLFHALGYVSQVTNEDLLRDPSLKSPGKIGRLGVEAVYDSFLKGIPGGQIFETDAQNRERRLLREIPSQPGNNLVLNISARLQSAAARILKEGLKNSSAVGGAAVVSEVKTGRILTLVSLPSLDPNIFGSRLSLLEFEKLQNDPAEPFFNRAVQGVFPPGSVFKLVVAAGALSEKIVNEQTLIDGPGSLTLGSATFRDWKPEGHGKLNIVGALSESCDTCFYQIGGGYQSFKGLGPERMASYARLFGLGNRLAIDLASEAQGLVPDPDWKKKAKGERWFTGNSYNFAIGQGDLLATPLQINFLTAAIGNGGTLFEPLIAQKIIDSQGVLVRNFPPQVSRRNFVSDSVLKVVRQGMKRAVEPGGTAFPFFNSSLSLGGKTGTAETGGNKTHAWFTAFAPFENPEVAVTVFLEEGGEGSRDAAPIAKKILEEYFREK